MSDFTGLYNIRDGVESDKSFILSTFLRGLYYGDSWFSTIPKDTFMMNYKNVLKALIDSPRAVAKIACLPDDPDVILGYSLLSSDYQTVHWVYVKKNWRGKGIGKSLTPQYPTTVTHLSALGKQLLAKYENTEFNPFKI